MHCPRRPAASVANVLLRGLCRLCGTVGHCPARLCSCPCLSCTAFVCSSRLHLYLVCISWPHTTGLLALHDTLCNEVDASPKTYGFARQRRTCWAIPSPRHTLTRICDRLCMHTWPTCTEPHDRQGQHDSFDPPDGPRHTCVHMSSEDELPCPPAVARPCRSTATAARADAGRYGGCPRRRKGGPVWKASTLVLCDGLLMLVVCGGALNSRLKNIYSRHRDRCHF